MRMTDHERTDDAVRQYVDGFNLRDVKTMALAEGEQHGASGYVVTLSEPRHVTVTGDNAHVVVPSSMTFKVHGKQVTQTARDLYGGSPQAQRRVAHSGLGMGKRWSIAAQMIASGRDFARNL
jgi:hypothetical protein